MRVPDSLVRLQDQGLIEEIVRPLLSGKEAQVYLVRSEGEQRIAKVYKDAAQRSFKHRSEYTEGRKVRNTRDQRAMSKRTRYGRSQDEDQWKAAEVDVIYKLRSAGVLVPEPFLFVDGVLVMELITDGNGEPAPRLADAKLRRDQIEPVFEILLKQAQKMLCAGVVHGDLSDYNILMGPQGPVIIDFPQSVDPASNQNARKLLVRDVRNLSNFAGKFFQKYRRLNFGEEMWDLYEDNALSPDTPLTGKRRRSEAPIDTTSILDEIADIERESRERRVALGLEPVRAPRQPVPIADQPKPTEKKAESPRSPKRRRRRRRSGPERSASAPASPSAAKPAGSGGATNGRTKARKQGADEGTKTNDSGAGTTRRRRRRRRPGQPASSPS